MTKRAKLHLISDKQKAGKKTAPLDSDTGNTEAEIGVDSKSRHQDEPAAASSASTSQKTTKQIPQNGPDEDTSRQDDEVSVEITPKLRSKVLLKAVIIAGVTVAAVVVYLYRRRLR